MPLKQAPSPLPPTLLLLALATAACYPLAPGDELPGDYVDNSTYGQYYADPRARRYRTGVIDGHVLRVPARVQSGVFAQPEQHLDALASYLVKGAQDDYHKVKRLHDWIAEYISYDASAYGAGQIPSQEVGDVLRRRKAVCDGFSNLFFDLATRAGLQSMRISGQTRGYSFLTSGKLAGHAWNAVQIGGRRYLLDVSRDGGYLANGATVKSYSTQYLFLAPTAFAYTHLPASQKHQMLSRPVSYQGFLDRPYLSGLFFTHRLGLPPPSLRFSNEVQGRQVLTLKAPKDVLLKALVTDTEDTPQEYLSFYQRRDDEVIFEFKLPEARTYHAQIYARRKQDVGESFTRVALYRLRSTTGGGLRWPFPHIYNAFVEKGASVSSPLVGKLSLGVPWRFAVTAPGALKVALIADPSNTWTYLTPQGGGAHSASHTLPAGTSTVYVVAKYDASSSTYTRLLRYVVP
jgi:hypothetical protein